MSSRRVKLFAVDKAKGTNPKLDPLRGVSQNDVPLTPPRSNSKQSDKLLSSPKSVTFNNNISNMGGNKNYLNRSSFLHSRSPTKTNRSSYNEVDPVKKLNSILRRLEEVLESLLT